MTVYISDAFEFSQINGSALLHIRTYNLFRANLVWNYRAILRKELSDSSSTILWKFMSMSHNGPSSSVQALAAVVTILSVLVLGTLFLTRD